MANIETRDVYPFQVFIGQSFPNESLMRVVTPAVHGWAYGAAKFRNSGRSGRLKIVYVGLATERLLYYFNGDLTVYQVPYADFQRVQRAGFKVWLATVDRTFDLKFYRSPLHDSVISMLLERIRKANATIDSGPGVRERPKTESQAVALESESPASPFGPDEGILGRSIAEIAAEFRLRSTMPVSLWPDCPCGVADLFRVSEHAIACPACGRCFTDAGFQPLTRPGLMGGAEPVGAEPWRPVFLAEVDFADRPRIWALRPSDIAEGPDFIADRILEREVWD